MPNSSRYPCPSCYEAFPSYGEFDKHRRVVHGAPAYTAQPTMELRIAALDRTVAMLIREMERMQEGSEP